MAREVYYRQFSNRRQVAGFLGLASSPYASGELERCQGISRAGGGPVRATIIQISWLWLKHQPKKSQELEALLLGLLARHVLVALFFGGCDLLLDECQPLHLPCDFLSQTRWKGSSLSG